VRDLQDVVGNHLMLEMFFTLERLGLCVLVEMNRGLSLEVKEV